MKTLGKLKFNIYKDSFLPFVDTFSKIKNVNLDGKNADNENGLPQLTNDELDSLQKMALEMKTVVGGGLAALTSGGLAGMAAFGGVGYFGGAASTGALVSSLSGVAATNATLAWLGGGSLAAGGYGMAGGMMVLGGIVAGPVLAVGGFVMASKAEAAKHEAYSNLSKAELAAEEMRTAEVVTSGIDLRFKEVAKVLRRLDKNFKPMLKSLDLLVKSNKDFQSYSIEDKKGVAMSVALIKTLKHVLEAPLLSKDGSLTSQSREVVKLGKKKV